MSSLARPTISAAVEGLVDEAVARKLILEAGAIPGAVFGKAGKEHLRQKIGGYNSAARLSPWLVLVDLDHEEECPPELRRRWLPEHSPRMCFRITVRQVEAWLLADREQMASFLRIAESRIPLQPEKEDHAKHKLVALAGRSRKRAIREDMVPRPGSGRAVGRAYTSRLVEFVDSRWRPSVAAERSESLSRSLACLKRLVAGLAV